jgi:hypothetical protein
MPLLLRFASLQVQCCVQQNVAQLLPAVAASGARLLRLAGIEDVPGTPLTAGVEDLLRWPCKLAGQQALQPHAAALLKTPNPPCVFTSAVQLAGLQVTAADLVAAARSRTPGVEKWVLQEFSKQLDPLVKAVHKVSEVSAQNAHACSSSKAAVSACI